VRYVARGIEASIRPSQDGKNEKESSYNYL